MDHISMAAQLDFSRCRLKPFIHQQEDTETLINHPYIFITSEMRTGKSKIVIDATQFMFEAGIIDRVLVITPAPVRAVWYNPILGEIRKHGWLDIPNKITEFHTKIRSWSFGQAPNYLQWIITSFEFTRSKNRVNQLLPYCGAKTLIVGDESNFLKNYDAQQTKSFLQLRRRCGRVVLLNGTPISHSPLDLFSQGNILHPDILECKYITHYRSRYAIMEPVLGRGGKPILSPRGIGIQTITGWTNLEDIQQRFAPYVIRRLQKDCLDLPPKLDAVTLTAELTPETWRQYKNMKDELVVWLENGNVATAPQAAVKVLRLSQITSGFIGGVESAGIEEQVEEGFLESIEWGIDEHYDALFTAGAVTGETPAGTQPVSQIHELGREKLDVLLWLLKQRLEQNPNLHIVTWCRFRPELFRMLAAVTTAFPTFEVASIVGGQKKAERLRAMSLLHPDTALKKPTFVGGTYGTGSYGLNFTAATISVNLSFDYSLGKFKQSSDRIYGPGMIGPAAYFNIVACGPDGQKTIDHAIVAARRNADDLATWTTSAWIKALREE